LTKSVYHVQSTTHPVCVCHVLAAQTSSMVNRTKMELEHKALKYTIKPVLYTNIVSKLKSKCGECIFTRCQSISYDRLSRAT